MAPGHENLKIIVPRRYIDNKKEPEVKQVEEEEKEETVTRRNKMI
jgi:hypothetical protein